MTSQAKQKDLKGRGMVAHARWRDVEKKLAIRRLREEAFPDLSGRSATFDTDDHKNPEITRVCEEYVEKWDEMKANNIGIIFFGGVGTGKSFLACCIANALIDKAVKVKVINLSAFSAKSQNFAEREKLVEDVEKADLLIIDDFGAERDSSYAVEQVYAIIDIRNRAQKPLILTTNLSFSDIDNPKNLNYARIYDRIIDMCPIKLKMAGSSRRVGNAADRRNIARRLIGEG